MAAEVYFLLICLGGFDDCNRIAFRLYHACFIITGKQILCNSHKVSLVDKTIFFFAEFSEYVRKPSSKDKKTEQITMYYGDLVDKTNHVS